MLQEELGFLECLALVPLRVSSSEHAEVGKVWEKYEIAVVDAAMAANLLQLLTTGPVIC